MKCHALSAVAAVLILAAGATVHAQVSPVRLEVSTAKSSHDSSGHKNTQTRQLRIRVSSVSREAPADLQVRYYIFARDVKTREVNVLHKGEKKITLEGIIPAEFTTEPATASSEDRHLKTGRGGKTAGKLVEASGERIVGHGVQVFQGDKLLTEFFSPPAMKEEIDDAFSGGQVVPKPGGSPKKAGRQ